MNTLIQDGLIISPSGSYKGDIRICQEKIIEISKHLMPVEGEEIIQAEGYYIFPGFIDTHTHFDLDAGTFRTADNFYTGTKAAIAGGTTTILDFATQEKGKSLVETLKQWHDMAKGKCSCDYSFHMSITDWNEKVKKEIPIMTKEGITSYKLYMAYENLKVTDGEIYEILQEVEQAGGITGVHCENGDLVKEASLKLKKEGKLSPFYHPLSRPAEVEAEAVYRLLTIAKMAGTKVNIVHLSTKKAYDLVEKAREEGQRVYVESCPQYLLLDEGKYNLDGFESGKYVLSPPLRKQEDITCLWKALCENKIDTIGTDHCSFHFHGQKERGRTDFTQIPNGIPGVEHRAELIFSYGVNTGRITKEQMCQVLAENPAKLFGLYPGKGTIQVGSDADLVLWNSKKEGIISTDTQMQNVDYTPYEGMKIVGKPEMVLLRGNIVYKDSKIRKEQQGKFLNRKKAKG